MNKKKKIIFAQLTIGISLFFLFLLLFFYFDSISKDEKRISIVPFTISKINFKALSYQQALRVNFEPELFEKYDAHKLLPFALGNEPRFQSRMEYAENEFYKNDESLIGIEIFQKQFAHLNQTSISPHPNRKRAYFGLLHAHTSDSDAVEFPADAFFIGKNMAGLDFMAITDHPEFWLFKRKNAFEKCKAVAERSSTQDFIALCGFEYSNFFEGHYVVLNTPQWTSANSNPTIETFYNWLALPENKEAIVFFAHPGYHAHRRSWDFKRFKFDPRLVNIITGEEVIHRNMWRAYSKGFSGQKPYLDETIEKGWKVGCLAAQDNHKKNWGIQNSSRIGLLMENLSEENIYKALKKRNYYATHAEGLQFSVDILTKHGQWLPMGSDISSKELSPKFTVVRARFALAEYEKHPIKEFQVVSDGKVIKNYVLEQNNTNKAGEFEFHLEFPKISNGLSYFYIRMFHKGHPEYVTQSSPIFISFDHSFPNP
ncbi:MAG: CehA/McbA family metallohydrolase [Silvanigrellaceae bacterium]|nr:CehA/McbA family metallohydrolase [Silvanigrellaceae bacterium]